MLARSTTSNEKGLCVVAAELLDDEQQRSERETRRANRATLIACIIGALFVLVVFIDALLPTRGCILR